jgi:sec-independent protein translocase protein TatA
MIPTLAFILGPLEMMIVGGIFLLLFGSRIPTVMRSLGQSASSFKQGMDDDEENKPDDKSSGKKN